MREFSEKVQIIWKFWEAISAGSSVRDFILGAPVRDFCKRLATYCGARYAIGVASGTDALILSLKACGIQPGDEVITPAVGFYSTAGAAAWIGAVPVFVDVDGESMNMNPKKIAAAVTARTKAIVPAHLNGRMADMDPIVDIARGHGLRIVVDAAHAIGARYKNKPLGAFGDCICLSLNPSKTLGTYGDGGAVLTNDRVLAETLARMSFYGVLRWRDIHSENRIPATASRLGTLEAVVLNHELSHLDSSIERQRTNYFGYQTCLASVGDLAFSAIPPDYFINGYRFVARTKRRDALLKFLQQHGAEAYSFYPTPLPYLPVFKSYARDETFPVAEAIAQESFVLWPHPRMSRRQIMRTAVLVRCFFESASIPL